MHVLYGSPSGLIATGDQLWTAHSDGIAQTNTGPLGEDQASIFGWEMATGDFDDDGFADLAIGSPGEVTLVDPRPRSLGVVHILYGSAKGLKGTNEIRWPGQAGIEDVALRFGRALAGGDFDGDGIDDLAVATFWSTGFNTTDKVKPAVAVLRGTPDGLGKVASTVWYQPGIGGSELAAGDLDGDGTDDLAIGSSTVSGFAGQVRVLFGDANDIGSRNVLLTQSTDGLARYPGDEDGASMWERFGSGLAIADFDSDGRSDLAIGSPGEGLPDAPCFADTTPDCPGIVTIVPGAADGLDLGSSFVLAQGFDGLAGSSEPADRFGEVLAAGDLNRDGWMDLAIGAPGETIDMLCQPLMCLHGAVTVVYGSVDGLVPSSASVWTLETPGVPGQISIEFPWYEEFGASLAIGSFGMGPAADLAIGVPGFQVDVLYGARAGLFEQFTSRAEAPVRRPSTGSEPTHLAQIWSPNTAGIKGAAVGYFGFVLSQ